MGDAAGEPDGDREELLRAALRERDEGPWPCRASSPLGMAKKEEAELGVATAGDKDGDLGSGGG